jgi:hypothetical protein
MPADVRTTDAVKGMSPDEIAANVMRAMQKAQSKYPQRLQEITVATVGEHDTTRHIVATAVEQFPEVPEESLMGDGRRGSRGPVDGRGPDRDAGVVRRRGSSSTWSR